MLVLSDIIRGYTDTIILSMLEKRDSYGYEINKTISEMSDKQFELKEATLYTTFRRLEDGGYIYSYWGDENLGARRRYYGITPLGTKLLAENRNDWQKAKILIDNLLKEKSDEQ